MSAYNLEQLDALIMVRRFVAGLTRGRKQELLASLADYLGFRREVDRFFAENFAEFCDHKCFQTRVSACCSKEGIVTFFADVVVNALLSSGEDLDRIETALAKTTGGNKCVYLGPEGCLLRVSPIVCAMFLCDAAKKEAFSKNPSCARRWEELKNRRKTFTWPDQPVLFDYIEQVFIEVGLESPLMYLHNTPGMLRVKQQAKK